MQRLRECAARLLTSQLTLADAMAMTGAGMAAASSSRSPLHLFHLPVELIDQILLHMSYDEIARLRLVSAEAESDRPVQRL